MPVKNYKPTSPGRRGMTVSTFEQITKVSPEKKLLRPLPKKSGRNARGVITVRHRGGGHKRQYRLIDFKRDKFDIPAVVSSIEYDPNRSARIALLIYVDGEKRYILAPQGIRVGDKIMAGSNAEIKPGHAMAISRIPLGTQVHNVELYPGKGGQLVRSAGTSAQVVAKEGAYAQLRLPSGEVRMVSQNCMATIGVVGNVKHNIIKIGKAGRKRWLGVRPSVRGTAMDPHSHPHGGGEGRSPVGMAGPKTPWGKPALGAKTRRNKLTGKYIVRQRSKKR